MTKQVYADFAATTPTDERVVEAMKPYWTADFGNPSSLHLFGQEVSAAVSIARARIATFLNSDPDEIYFTGSGTESNNLAILGIAKANRKKGNHIITTNIEHPSVLNACRALERDGFKVTYLPADADGLVRPWILEEAITDKTILISIHLANSEVGVVQPITELAKIANKKQILFHTDACQAGAFKNLDTEVLGVDLLTFNGSKIYGPKGIAVLFVKEGVSIFPLVYGGGQEQSLRSGTENVPAIIGLAKAVEIVESQRSADVKRITKLRDSLQVALAKLPGVSINVLKSPRLPNHLSLTLAGQSGRDLVTELDKLGIAVSAGSACSSKSLVESHVLKAIGLTSEQANSTIRISLGRSTTAEDCLRVIKAIKSL